MGEVERIRPGVGASFGSDLGPRIMSLADRQSRKHEEEEEKPSHEDAVELHGDTVGEHKSPTAILIFESSDHLDLSA